MNVNYTQSAALILYCLGERRYTHPNAYFMMHAISWDSKGMTPAKNKDI